MRRLSRAKVINDIEFIVHTPPPPMGAHVWTASGAECRLERHSFSGDVYMFQVEVLHLTMPASGRQKWKIVLVTEYWHLGEGMEPHANRWIKVLSGKPLDVMRWVVASREEKLPPLPS